MKSQIRKVEKLIKALANQRRLQIIKFLNHGKPATVGEIAEELHLSMPAVSKHLALLAREGIVDYNKRGSLIYYELDEDPGRIVDEVLALL